MLVQLIILIDSVVNLCGEVIERHVSNTLIKSHMSSLFPPTTTHGNDANSHSSPGSRTLCLGLVCYCRTGYRWFYPDLIDTVLHNKTLWSTALSDCAHEFIRASERVDSVWVSAVVRKLSDASFQLFILWIPWPHTWGGPLFLMGPTTFHIFTI